ncbi:MAG: 4Fe-4S dicluster domain-containing protein [Methanomassiliicoccales archaeon]|nr:4Fe-4S dicluster domain-containing protein [Methanomassiliicoccales archaeon]
MSKAIDLGPRPQEGLRDALDRLMDAGEFAGVVSLGSTSGGAVDYLLVMKGQNMSDLRPLHPVIPNQVGRLLREMTLRGPLKERLLVIARPCELRGFVEMVKRQQGDLTNMVFVSMVCSGAFPLSMSVSGSTEKRSEEYWSSLGKGALPDLRPACLVCTELVPYTADLVMAPVEEGRWSLAAWSDEGSKLMEAAFPSVKDAELDRKTLERMVTERKANRPEVLGKEADVHGLADLVKIFGRCIGCHACSKACPICYCTLCTFESARMEERMEQIEGELDIKGGVRAPTGTVLFHIGRMGHMAVSCIACGSCQDVCPTNIPVSLLFKKVGEAVQARFNYVPGRDVKEKQPINTFQPIEFKEMGK